MNSYSLVSLDAVQSQPWKNGGGTTRELLKDPEGRYRISVAEIKEDGNFSCFPGAQRWFAVLMGQGVHLNIGGTNIAQKNANNPLCFDGDETTTCRLLAGATQDLNLMLHGVTGCMRLIQNAPCQTNLNKGTLIAIYAQEAASLNLDGLKIAIPAQTLFYETMKKSTELSCESEHALWMEIQL